MKKKLFRLAAALAIVGLVAGGFAYWYGFLRKEKPMEKRKADYTMAADSLFSLFSADEKAATEKFGGKIILLTSNVVSVDRDGKGNVTITLVDPMAGVTCTVDSLDAIRQSREIQTLAEGMPVKIKGRCDGMLSDVKISRCTIVK